MRSYGLALVAFISMPSAALASSEGAVVPTSTAGSSLARAGDHRALLRQLEQRIDDLQQQIVVAQERVEVLKDTVLEGTVSKARARIVHANDMRGKFLLAKATYTLDGGAIFDREDVDGSLSDQAEIVLFDGPITPGEHEMRVSLVFRIGSGAGVFTYAEGYKFKVESRYVLKVVDGRMNVLRIVSHDKSEADVSVETTDRIGVRYDFETKLEGPSKPKLPEQPEQPIDE